MQTTISLAQLSLEQSPDLNLIKTEAFLKQAKIESSDLVVFPEMWTTGFTNTHHVTLPSVCDLAREYHISICGSLPLLQENGLVSNSCVFINPLGQVVSIYNKVHLFSPSWEERQMQAGDRLVTLDHPWGKSGFAICYDLRFPEVFRSYALMGAKVIFLVAAFPHPRQDVWMTLMKARAIENQLYMVCVNRVGSESFQGGVLNFCGNSAMISPQGEILCLGNAQQEKLLTLTIDIALVKTIRDQIEVFKDRKPTVYKLDEVMEHA